MSAITIRPMTPEAEDLGRFGACFAKHDSPKRPESLRWQYAANPTKQVFVDFAMSDDGRLAAIYATLPSRFRIRGRVELGVQSVDTITDEDFRGKGLFLKLAKSTYARAAESGARLVYGFPNGNSAHGFFERLDWKNLDPVPFLIRPLRTGYVLDRLGSKKYTRLRPDVPLLLPWARGPRRGTVERITRFDARASALWAAFSAQVGVAVERDEHYLNWRLSKPGEDYRHLAVIERDRMTALVSFTVKSKHDGRIGYVMESLCLPGADAQLRGLLRLALADMGKERADVVLAWCMPHSPTYPSLVRNGFFPFPTKLRPIELHFGARAFAPEHADVIERREGWYLSYLDSDTV